MGTARGYLKKKMLASHAAGLNGKIWFNQKYFE
jgi:hypothetical protein